MRRVRNKRLKRNIAAHFRHFKMFKRYYQEMYQKWDFTLGRGNGNTRSGMLVRAYAFQLRRRK